MTRIVRLLALAPLAASLAPRLLHAQQVETVYEITSPLWYEDAARFYRVSPDGRRAQYGSGPLVHFIDLTRHAEGSLPPGDTLPPPGDAHYRLVAGKAGLSTLVRTGNGTTDTLRRGLDGAWSVNFVAAAPDGRTLYLALASEGVPSPAARHQPDADRNLDLYALDLKAGTLRAVAKAPHDDCCPTIANGYLYWTHNEPDASVVVMSIDSGASQVRAARVVARDGFLPRFSPDNAQVAYTKGSFRLADYGLDMDEWVVTLDATGQPSTPRPLVTGYGEDMGAAWSPDGKWLAYHSHRAAVPYPLYDSPARPAVRSVPAARATHRRRKSDSPTLAGKWVRRIGRRMGDACCSNPGRREGSRVSPSRGSSPSTRRAVEPAISNGCLCLQECKAPSSKRGLRKATRSRWLSGSTPRVRRSGSRASMARVPAD